MQMLVELNGSVTWFIYFYISYNILCLYIISICFKETLVEVFSCGFCQISKNNFTEHLRTTSFLRQPLLDPACPPSKIFVFPPHFSVPPSFKVFQTVSPHLTRTPPALFRQTNLLYMQLTGLNKLSKYQKSDFTS